MNNQPTDTSLHDELMRDREEPAVDEPYQSGGQRYTDADERRFELNNIRQTAKRMQQQERARAKQYRK